MPDTHILDKMITISQDKERKEFSPQEMVESLLSLIELRESKIIKLRYGFDNQKSQTLEAIGKEMNLTRERVRQLEKQALINMSKNTKYAEIIAPLKHLVDQTLKEHGGLMSLQLLTYEIIEFSNDQQAEPFIRFLLTNCISGIEIIKNKNFELSFKLFDMSMDFINEVLDILEQRFVQADKILEPEDIIRKFKNSDFYQNNKEKFFKENIDVNKIIFSYLSASQKFIKTPIDQWGLKDWSMVKPRRINGKVYLVLLAKKKPLHFTKISKIINEKWVDARDISEATVHNELIADDRFALVGRGIYALKEWGYESKNVEEIVKDILKKDKDLSDKEVVEKVLEKKVVNENTIRMAIRKINSE